MSSIIKGERIRNQSIINLSERFTALHIEYEKAEIEDDTIALPIKSLQEEPDQEVEEIHEILEDPHEQSKEILEEANKTAEQIIEAAKQRAEEILTAALTKAEELKEETQSKQTQLLYETNTKSEEVLENARREASLIQQQAETEKTALISSSEGELVQVLRKLLSHIISEEVFENTQWLQCMVRKMLQECSNKEEIKVCVSASLFERLTEDQKEKIQALGEKVTLEIRNTLNESTCLVETPKGNISYDVMEGLERVISEIKTLEKLS